MPDGGQDQYSASRGLRTAPSFIAVSLMPIALPQRLLAVHAVPY